MKSIFSIGEVIRNMIIEKYYGSSLRLRKLDNHRKNEPILRMKILKDKTEFPCCDFRGVCTNKAYAEVFPGALKKNKGWSYLCKKHYYQEERRLKWKLPACLTVQW